MWCKTYKDIEGMADLAVQNPQEFTMMRRKGFGASDSSILLGVNQWTTFEQLITQKNSEEVTEDELKVGEKPQVRMGNDLEPLVRDKFSAWYGQECEKPTAQLRLCDYPQLTINYDGMVDMIPVECKTISMFATKHWGFDKALATPDTPTPTCDTGICVSIKDKVMQQSEMLGIPPYYYTQVQQQLLGTPVTYAYLAALCVKDWTLYVFRVPQDEEVQQAIISKSIEAAAMCPRIQAECDKLF